MDGDQDISSSNRSLLLCRWTTLLNLPKFEFLANRKQSSRWRPIEVKVWHMVQFRHVSTHPSSFYPGHTSSWHNIYTEHTYCCIVPCNALLYRQLPDTCSVHSTPTVLRQFSLHLSQQNVDLPAPLFVVDSPTVTTIIVAASAAGDVRVCSLGVTFDPIKCLVGSMRRRKWLLLGGRRRRRRHDRRFHHQKPSATHVRFRRGGREKAGGYGVLQ